MSARVLGRLALLALTLLSREAHAQVDAMPQPNMDSLAQAAKRVKAAHCDRAACRSIVLIDRVVKLQIAGVAATVGRPRPIPRNRDVQAASSYKTLVEQGRALTPELCRQAAALLSGYGAPRVASEVVVPVAVLNLTARLDGEAASAGCTRIVIHALPTSSASDVAVHNARALCAAQDETRSCANISR